MPICGQGGGEQQQQYRSASCCSGQAASKQLELHLIQESALPISRCGCRAAAAVSSSSSTGAPVAAQGKQHRSSSIQEPRGGSAAAKPRQRRPLPPRRLLPPPAAAAAAGRPGDPQQTSQGAARKARARANGPVAERRDAGGRNTACAGRDAQEQHGRRERAQRGGPGDPGRARQATASKELRVPRAGNGAGAGAAEQRRAYAGDGARRRGARHAARGVGAITGCKHSAPEQCCPSPLYHQPGQQHQFPRDKLEVRNRRENGCRRSGRRRRRRAERSP
jgi:hypothetical protein